MIRSLVCATLTLLPLPALADDVFVTIINQSRQSAAINTYPIGSDGEPVEDNIGSYADIAAGTRGAYRLDSTECGVVLVAVIMADTSEMRATIDLCTASTLVISD